MSRAGILGVLAAAVFNLYRGSRHAPPEPDQSSFELDHVPGTAGDGCGEIPHEFHIVVDDEVDSMVVMVPCVFTHTDLEVSDYSLEYRAGDGDMQRLSRLGAIMARVGAQVVEDE